MKINPVKFGLACALSVSILWIVCSILVMVIPPMMLSMSGHMLHMELAGMSWHITLLGVFTGLVGWFVTAGIGGWLLAAIYNCLLGRIPLDIP
jgi:uncharacterized membrane protein